MRVLLVIAMLVSGCSATSDVPGLLSDETIAQPEAAASAVPKTTKKPAVKATAKPKPKATRKPTPKPASFYKPRGWNGSSDVNCPQFDTHAHAQSFFKGTGGSRSNDPYGLDRDHDGIACETLP
jgi:hypothetical protein